MTRLLLFPLLCALIVTTAQCQTNPPDSSEVETPRGADDLFDPQLVECINQATSVTTYLLNGWEQDPSPAGFYNFKVVWEHPLAEELDDRFLSNLLAQRESYHLEAAGRSCEFVPNIGVMFVRGNVQATFLFSFACDIAKVYFNSEPAPKVLKMDPITMDLENYFVGLFPDMKAVLVNNLQLPDDIDYNLQRDTTEVAINDSPNDDTATQDPQENTDPEPESNPDQVPVDNANTVTIHVVQENETLWAISRQYGVESIEVMRWNDLVNDLIHPGQRLKIHL